MKICVFGAGAIGGWIGALLARKGVEVSLVARGAHLAAIRAKGLRLITASEEFTVHPKASDRPEELGPQDYVLLTLKAHSLPPAVESLKPLLGPETAVVTAMNGIPWWYFHRIGGDHEGRMVESVDPGGKVWATIGPERAIGCVVWPAADMPEPGVIRHEYGERLTLGEPSGERTARGETLSKLLGSVGLKSPLRPRIRDEIWIKLWGNVAFNPLSALTRSTLDILASDPDLRPLVLALMTEAKAVAEAFGTRFAMSIEERIKSAASVGAHKTSMLVDLESGRPMEIDALVSATVELGRIAGVPTPTIDTVRALVIRRAREAGCYPR